MTTSSSHPTPSDCAKQSQAMPDGRRTRDTLVLIGLLGLVLTGLLGLAAATGWDETRAQLMTLSIGQLSVLLALSLVNYLFRALRWHLFAHKLGLPTGLWQNLRHFIGGFAMSVTPGRVGELIRMRWLWRETGWRFERTAPLALADRASDLTAMGMILALALAFSATGIAGGLPISMLALVAAFCATRPAMLSWLATIGHRITGRFARIWAKTRRAGKSLSAFASPALTILAAMLGAVGWIAEGYAFHLLLMWMGADIGLAKAIAIFVFSTLAGGLTGAPGGLGGAEAAMVALLTLEGVPLDISVPATALIRVTTLWFAIGLGILVFPIAERYSLRQRHGLEKN